MFQKRIYKLLSIAIILAHLSLIGCENNPSEPENAQQPELPPLSSMKIDLNLFNGTANAAKAADVNTPGANFNNAALRVLLINATVTLVVVVPVATFAAAVSQQPKLEADGKWHWVFNVTNNGKNYQADLAGTLDLINAESVWEMRITAPNNDPALNDFLWYKGRAKLDNTSGEWHVYDHLQPNDGIETLQINWSHPSETEATLEFTIVKPAIPENGDVLTYHVKDNDRSIKLFDNSKNATIEIFWDAITGAGYLIDPNYKSGEKSCWDALKNDTTCSS
ncbi:MAG: hypothetical protein ACE5I1_06990 [bacterium]